jgi:hypothetical protein
MYYLLFIYSTILYRSYKYFRPVVVSLSTENATGLNMREISHTENACYFETGGIVIYILGKKSINKTNSHIKLFIDEILLRG